MPSKNTGFTLIEVLIAMMILAVGLLGLAAMQAYSLKNNQSAYYRSQATQLAYDIADRMRVNVASAAAYTGGSVKEHKECLTATGCTPVQMAEHDLSEWNKALQTSIMANATGKIAMTTLGAVNTYTVTIEWDENRKDTQKNIAGSQTRFEMSFRL